ncbi:MAG: DUF2752 domain-containing protein [Bryobacteraceae bacterium]
MILARTGLLAASPLFCPFHALSGLPCPLCGITRAFVALSSGQWWEALTLHPFVFLVLPVLVASAFGWRPGPRVFFVLCAGLVTFGAVRIAILTL